MRILVFITIMAASLFAAGELSNRRAPGFALPDGDYKHYYDLQDYRGKVLLLDIMQTTCPHCMLLSTTLEKIKEHYGDKIAILSVVLPPDNPNTVQKYVAMNKITVPVVFDMGQMTISYFNAKPGQAHIDVPHLFLIDKQGMIRNDFDYKNEKDRAIFDGSGLYAEIDKLIK